jgi:HEAT repeat protein
VKPIQAVAAGVAAAVAGKALAGELEDLLPKIGSDNLNDRKNGRDRFEDIVLASGKPGGETERAATSKAVCALLEKEMNDDARCWLLRELWLIGGAEAIPALVKHLDHKGKDVADAARRALQKNSSPEATTALVSALGKATDADWKVALLIALGGRIDAKAIAAVAKCLTEKEAKVVSAAAAALGQIGGADAAKALAGARTKVPADLRPVLSDRYLQIAEGFLREGKYPEALAIYKEMDAASESEQVKLAARQGQLAVELSKKAGAGKMVYPEVKAEK